jgi:two-component system response regulator AtoC
MTTLLIVDDEPAIQHAFQRAFRGELDIQTAMSAEEAVDSFRHNRADVIILDVHLPDASGMATYHRLREIDARVPIVMMTGHGTSELAIEAMKEGAFDYLLKPLELTSLRELIERAIRSSRLMRVPAVMPEEESAPQQGDYLIGRCPAMQDVYKAIGRVARQDVTVLIQGESGTGKELVARAIYQHSDRSDKPFVTINCGAIPEHLVESELFGHERGAFTGADRKRIGRFEQANGGTIFLDEVGELPLLAQVKMLRVLQEKQFERVGGEEVVTSDVRVIAATNADLEKMSDEGRFRKDLYFRLNVFTVKLPPLRERGEDVSLLLDHYIRRYGQELVKPVQTVAPEAMVALQGYPFPGNIRELQSILKQALLQMRGTVLLAEDLPDYVVNSGGLPPEFVLGATSRPTSQGGWSEYVGERIRSGSENVYAECLDRMERDVLVQVLRHTGGNQLQGAKILGITRGSLRTKIRSLGINIRNEVWSDDNQSNS